MLNGTIRGRLTEVKFEQRPEESKGPSHAAPWGRRVPDRGSSKCKGREAGMYLGCLGKSKEAGEAGVK